MQKLNTSQIKTNKNCAILCKKTIKKQRKELKNKKKTLAC